MVSEWARSEEYCEKCGNRFQADHSDSGLCGGCLDGEIDQLRTRLAEVEIDRTRLLAALDMGEDEALTIGHLADELVKERVERNRLVEVVEAARAVVMLEVEDWHTGESDRLLDALADALVEAGEDRLTVVTHEDALAALDAGEDGQ